MPLCVLLPMSQFLLFGSMALYTFWYDRVSVWLPRARRKRWRRAVGNRQPVPCTNAINGCLVAAVSPGAALARNYNARVYLHAYGRAAACLPYIPCYGAWRWFGVP